MSGTKWYKEEVSWHSFKEKDKFFFQKVCDELGEIPAVLESIAKVLNEIGASYTDDGIRWICRIIENNNNLQFGMHGVNTRYYLEKIVRKYSYLYRSKIKTDTMEKKMLLVILDFLISRGSVNAYLLREDIL